MDHYFGPMEGITTSAYRQVHSRLFPGCDRYYTPFISPTRDHLLTARDHRELDPERNEGICLVPQLLTKSGEDFLWCADRLGEMGYRQVDLNVGCPSATVTAKGKGAGLLRTPDVLRRLLDEIFARAELPVSVKTRIGYQSPEEFPTLLEIYNRYPIRELILHPRTRQDMYAPGTVHREAWDYALAHSRAEVIYNGDLFTAADAAAFAEAYPGQRAAVFARGGARDPALFRRLKGGSGASREELREFHRELSALYFRDLGPLNGMRRMRELWLCMLDLFENTEKLRKTMARTQDVNVFENAVSAVLRDLPMRKE